MLKPESYAILIRKSNLALITLLNDGVVPTIKPKTYLVFTLNGPNDVTTKIVTERELANGPEIGGNSPFIMKLKNK